MSVLGRLHGRFVFDRRINVLAGAIEPLLPRGTSVLDVGCGDGQLDRLLLSRRSDVRITGLDVFVRPDAHIGVEEFDGTTVPRPDDSVDVVLMVDVLHHTPDPTVLLAEAARVSRRHVILKDHTANGLGAVPTLRLMDWVGNAPHGVVLPYNYWPRARWLDAFRKAGLTVGTFDQRLGLYPPPAKWVFERSLHFLARLDVADA